MIAIIDYGAGNLRSVANAIVKLGYEPSQDMKNLDYEKPL
jgi:imidazoleglycerol phosphate synthase glutamine amidotransferase subunit HisH